MPTIDDGHIYSLILPDKDWEREITDNAIFLKPVEGVLSSLRLMNDHQNESEDINKICFIECSLTSASLHI